MSSNGGMGFFYGNFSHPPGEVFPAKVSEQSLYDSRNRKWATEYRLHVAGDFIGELNPGAISAKISAMDSAYREDYLDCGFTVAGGSTPHRLLNNDNRNLSGNQVVYRSWDHLHPTEYANTRSFSVIVRAIFLAANAPAVLEFEERVTKIGDGGPTWELFDTINGPEKVDILPRSKVVHVQRGYVVGTTARLSPPGPLWPAEEKRWMRQITTHSPKFLGNPSNRPAHYFRTDFAYFFERLGPDAIAPRNWYS